jgi:hypothetical protein
MTADDVLEMDDRCVVQLQDHPVYGPVARDESTLRGLVVYESSGDIVWALQQPVDKPNDHA